MKGTLGYLQICLPPNRRVGLYATFLGVSSGKICRVTIAVWGKPTGLNLFSVGGKALYNGKDVFLAYGLADEILYFRLISFNELIGNSFLSYVIFGAQYNFLSLGFDFFFPPSIFFFFRLCHIEDLSFGNVFRLIRTFFWICLLLQCSRFQKHEKREVRKLVVTVTNSMRFRLFVICSF